MTQRSAEHLKHRPEDFGGIQFDTLDEEELSQRMCAARFCGNNGFAQIANAETHDSATEFYRVVCMHHLIRLVISQAVVLGDPSPTSDARSLADAIGLDWSAFLRTRPLAEPMTPEEFRCFCGGNLVAETAGMKQGKRWVHTCEPE